MHGTLRRRDALRRAARGGFGDEPIGGQVGRVPHDAGLERLLALGGCHRVEVLDDDLPGAHQVNLSQSTPSR